MKRNPNIWSANHSEDNFRNEYPEFSMVSLLKETAEKYPDYIALEFENKKTNVLILFCISKKIFLWFFSKL